MLNGPIRDLATAFLLLASNSGFQAADTGAGQVSISAAVFKCWSASIPPLAGQTVANVTNTCSCMCGAMIRVRGVPISDDEVRELARRLHQDKAASSLVERLNRALEDEIGALVATDGSRHARCWSRCA